MPQYLGANVDELRELAQFFDTSGQQLSSISTVLTTRIMRSSWEGPDNQNFVVDWQSRLAPHLTRSSGALHAASQLLVANALEQEAASDGGGSAGGPSDGLPRSTNPLNPDIGDMKDYEPFDGEISFDPNDIRFYGTDDYMRPDVQQGQLGDCWFLSGAGAIALYDPEFIEEHVKYNDDGTYTVTMYRDGKPVEITVEASAPGDAVSGMRGANWATVYEKAAADYYGGEYSDLDGGHSDDAFEAMTGGEGRREGELNFDSIKDRLADGPVAVASERADPYFWFDTVDEGSEVVGNHAYMVGGFSDSNPETGAKGEHILVINPWGTGDLWLTEQEYKDNFATVYSTEMDK